MNHQPRIDPDPITTSVAVVTATAAIVGMIGVIHNARRQERRDREQAEKERLEEARAERDEDRRAREEARREEELRLQRQKQLQDAELVRIDVRLEVIERKLEQLRSSLEEAKRVDGSSRYVMRTREFERYRSIAIELAEEVPKVTIAVLNLEASVDAGPLLDAGAPQAMPFEDDDDAQGILHQLDQAWLIGIIRSQLEPAPGYVDSSDAAHAYVRLVRRRVRRLLNDAA